MNLKVERINAGLTLQEMANALGVSKQAVYAWEKGIKNIPNNRINEIKKILNNPNSSKKITITFTYEEYQELLKFMPNKAIKK